MTAETPSIRDATTVDDMTRDERQQALATWALDTFGSEHLSLPERACRLVEEAVELAQVDGVDRAQLHRLIDYVYSRPVGERGREVGGVAVCLAIYRARAGLSANAEEIREATRILSHPTEQLRTRHATKITAGITVEGG